MTQIIEDINEIVNNENLFSPLKYSSVLITGATGLIGSMLIRAISTANSRYSLGMKVFGQIRDFEKTKALFGENFQSVEFVTNPDIKCNYIGGQLMEEKKKFAFLSKALWRYLKLPRKIMRQSYIFRQWNNMEFHTNLGRK